MRWTYRYNNGKKHYFRFSSMLWSIISERIAKFKPEYKTSVPTISIATGGCPCKIEKSSSSFLRLCLERFRSSLVFTGYHTKAELWYRKFSFVKVWSPNNWRARYNCIFHSFVFLLVLNIIILKLKILTLFSFYLDPIPMKCGFILYDAKLIWNNHCKWSNLSHYFAAIYKYKFLFTLYTSIVILVLVASASWLQ